MSEILAVGSMAFDSIETPFGNVGKILGGSANYFSISASNFTPVKLVSVVGRDFPKEHLELLKSRGIDVRGIKIEDGETFHWKGKYGYDLNEAHTLATFLNVFERFEPQVPEEYKKTPFIFLGNIAPSLQMRVLNQAEQAKFIALDTMNFWIEGQRDGLLEVIARCNAVIINEGEARQLTKSYNILQAGKQIQAWGPKTVVVKRGEYGAILFDGDEIFSLPGLPLAEVKDPTGAGDSFAGGFMGYLASQGDATPSHAAFRRAVVYGSVMASFAVQDFGFKELLTPTRQLIDDRYKRFIELTSFQHV